MKENSLAIKCLKSTLGSYEREESREKACIVSWQKDSKESEARIKMLSRQIKELKDAIKKLEE